MAIIKNADGTIGNSINANQFMLDNNLQAKYRLLQSYSKTNNAKTLTNVGGIGKDANTEKVNSSFPNVVNFLTKLESFTFAPPSDNLWNVEIYLESQNTQLKNDIVELYSNIVNVNKMWNQKVGTRWKIDLEQPSRTSGNTGETYIQHFSEKSGIFLAQDINFTPMSINVIDKPWSASANNNMFLNFGNVATGRSESKSLKISFLISNWDIGDILFDPWISAVGQQGLVEDDNEETSKPIKAKIVISEFSSSMPSKYIKTESSTNSIIMECRKQYIFHDCVPVSRGEVNKNYDFDSAGVFKKTIIDFRYEDYEIHYKY